MSAKLRQPGATNAFKMKEENKEKAPTKPQMASLNGRTCAVPAVAAEPVADAYVNGAEASSTDVFMTIFQDLLRNVLPKIEPVAMMDFRVVLEREVASALEAKGVCECNPDIVSALKARRARLDALKECLNDITQVSELNDIKRVASSRIKLLTKGTTYTRKMIKGNEYLYEVYWDPNEKKKKYKYIGPVPLAAARSSAKNGNGKHG